MMTPEADSGSGKREGARWAFHIKFTVFKDIIPWSISKIFFQIKEGHVPHFLWIICSRAPDYFQPLCLHCPSQHTMNQFPSKILRESSIKIYIFTKILLSS
jgi:hypothetical protein